MRVWIYVRQVCLHRHTETDTQRQTHRDRHTYVHTHEKDASVRTIRYTETN